VDQLTEPAGLVALGAAAVALLALLLVAIVALRVRRLRAEQRVVLGGRAREDLVTHAAALQEAFMTLHERVEEVAAGNGVVLSSITHRETARLYCKQVVDGRGEHLLSPEEDEAIRLALAGERSTVVLED